MSRRQFARFAWACALVMLAVSCATFIGGWLPTAYGLLALVVAGSSGLLALSIRRLDELIRDAGGEVGAGDAEPLSGQPNQRHAVVVTVVGTSIILAAVVAGVSTTVILVAFTVCFVAALVIELSRVRRQLRRSEGPGRAGGAG